MQQRFSVPAVLLCALLASSALMRADATYTYTGDDLGPDNPFSFAPYMSGDKVTGYFTVATPFGDGQSLTDVTALVTGFSFSDGLQTFNSSSTLTTKVFQVQTDSTGAIDVWGVILANGGDQILTCKDDGNTICTSPGWGLGGADETFFGGGVGLIENPGNNGTWTATPEPANLLSSLLLIGLGFIFSRVFRRLRD